MKFSKRFYRAQVDSQDCGAAALAMILEFYGSHYSLDFLRRKLRTTVNGTTAYGLVQVADKLGFETVPIKADISLFEIDDLQYPFIVHVKKNNNHFHYYVVIRCDKKYIYIADPVVNLTKMPYREFKEEWTGVTILLKPTSLYKPIKQDKVRLTYFIPLLLKEKRLIIKIIIISILVNMINILGSYFMKSIIDFYIPQKLKTWVS
ncbi:TPA: peptide ABC transporter ATP-binding protein, partial [Staphylococcus pseudintermedius]|nr:peptide ABC transporter ATP-binding protein [Staphylococcus pseudintermedius]